MFLLNNSISPKIKQQQSISNKDLPLLEVLFQQRLQLRRRLYKISQLILRLCTILIGKILMALMLMAILTIITRRKDCPKEPLSESQLAAFQEDSPLLGLLLLAVSYAGKEIKESKERYMLANPRNLLGLQVKLYKNILLCDF